MLMEWVSHEESLLQKHETYLSALIAVTKSHNISMM